MATATLVNSDIEIGRRIVGALARAGIPVSVSLWAFVPELGEWQFMIATPLVDTKGPLSAYGEVNKALQRDGIFEDVPLGQIFLKSPSDPALKSLEKQSKVVPRESRRAVNQQIAGNFVEEAYVYSGSIHITESENIPRGMVPSTYYIVYAPYSGAGSARLVRVDGLDELKEVLESRLHIHPDVVESTLKELATKHRSSIPNVLLRPSELKRLGLA